MRKPQLSPIEIEIMTAVSNWIPRKQIAMARGCSMKTVSNHLSRIYKFLGARNRMEAIAKFADIRLGHRMNDEIVYQTSTYNCGPQTAADEFARCHFDKPRKASPVVDHRFKLKGGVATYEIRVSRDGGVEVYQIVRLSASRKDETQ